MLCSLLHKQHGCLLAREALPACFCLVLLQLLHRVLACTLAFLGDDVKAQVNFFAFVEDVVRAALVHHLHLVHAAFQKPLSEVGLRSSDEKMVV